MNSLVHDTIFSSYSSRTPAAAPADGQMVHSTVFSYYDIGARIASLPARESTAKTGPAIAKPTATPSLLARFTAWRTARKNAREERAMWELAKGDAYLMKELNLLTARTS